MTWTISLSARARKDLRKLDATAARRVVAALDRLAQTEQGDVTRLRDVHPPQWRLRAGDVRVRFRYDPAARMLEVLHVLPRGKAYR